MSDYTMENIDKDVRLLKELERKAQDIDTHINNIKDKLKSHMTEQGVNELVGDDWKVTWSVISSTRFNQSEFSSAHPDLFEAYKRISESRRFTVN